MKIKLPVGQAPTLWPVDKAGVIEVANLWYKPELLSINEQAIDNLPQGTIKAPLQTNLTIEVSSDPRSLTDSIKHSIALNSINYMFWRLNEQGQFGRYEEAGKVGANLMTDSFNQAWQDIDSPLNQALLHGTPLTEADVHKIFGDIPDVSGRVRILNEVLTHPDLEKIALEMSDDARNGVTFDTHHAYKLAELFPQTYGDEVLKKAQLAISGVWRNAMEHGLKMECDLTAFADYQVPNVLRALGILDYNPELSAKIDAYQLIDENSVEEKAIRGASILAVEKLATQQGVNVADVDYWLWSKRKEPKTPFHLTDTTVY